MATSGLSVIITTYNEEDNIEGVIKSASFADEIIVVDSFSQDQTVEKAKKLNATIHQRKYLGPADQKNWIIPQASFQWVLILDADERVTPELQLEIQSILKEEVPFEAYWIPRQNFFLDKKINYSGWQNDAVIRLIQRDKCRYNDKQVHEEIITERVSVGKTRASIDHYTYKNIDHFLAKMQRYALWSAKDYESKTPKVTGFHLFFKPFFRFLKHYLFQKGFLDGKQGLIISVIMAWGVFLRYLYLFEQKNKEN